jgi:hypothetical protein
VCHHLDYVLLKLRDSFHTDGFFQRESSLMHQLLRSKPEKEQPTLPIPRAWGRRAEAPTRRSAAGEVEGRQTRIKFGSAEDYS